MDPIATGAIILTGWWLLRRRRRRVEVVIAPLAPAYATRPADAPALGPDRPTFYEDVTGHIEAVIWPDGTWIGGPN
jgi:hypothetical protein